MADLSWPKIRKLLRAPGIGFNAEVYRYFKNDDIDPKSVGGRTKVRDFCLIGAKDSRSTALSKIQYFRDQVQRVHENTALATVPESWDRRAGADIPQLIVVFRPPGKKSSYQLSIPHYDGSKQPQIPDYRKGSWRGELILKDNSRLVVNAFSEQEAFRVIRALQKYINKKMIGDRKPTARPIRGEGFKEDKVVPVFADYYPEGEKYGKKAMWRKRLS